MSLKLSAMYGGGASRPPCVAFFFTAVALVACSADAARVAGKGATGSGGEAGGGAPSGLTVVEVEAQHVIADPVRGVFYATVAGGAAEHANSLVVVDAGSGKVTQSIFVGSQPSTMALSEDASTLWVSLEGSYEIRRVDLATVSPVPSEKFALPPGDLGDKAFAGPMVVLPGTTGSVAVSLHMPNLSPSYAGSVILDDGVPRSKTTPGHTGASRLTGGPAGWLFGFNNLHTGFGFYSLQVLPDGLVSSEHDGLVSGFATDIVHAGDRVYSTQGDVVDVSSPALPKKAGTFAFSGVAVLPLGDNDRVLMLSTSFDEPVTLRLLDAKTFSQLDAVTYPSVDLQYAVDLVSTDGERLGFAAAIDFDAPRRLYVLSNPLGG